MGFSVSALFLSYNQERFVKDALESILAQDCGPFELVLADDASSDGTRQAIEQVLAARRPPHVKIVRLFHPTNLGLIGNFNAAMKHSTGDIIISCAGDDISEANRFRAMQGLLAEPQAQLACSAYTLIDEHGNVLVNQHDAACWARGPHCYRRDPGRLYAGSPVCGATAAFKRSVYDRFGPLSPGSHGEDNAMWVRALLLGSIVTSPLRLVRWRQHEYSASNFASPKLSLQERRQRRLRNIEAHSLMAPQWLEDISKATSAGMVSPEFANILRKAVLRETNGYRVALLILGHPHHVALPLVRELANLLRVGHLGLAWKLFRYRYGLRSAERLWGRMGMGK